MNLHLLLLLKAARECIEEYHDLLIAMQTDKELIYDYSDLLGRLDDAIDAAEESNGNDP